MIKSPASNILRKAAMAGTGVCALGLSALVLPTQDFFYLLGHLSFVITFLAYAQSNLIKLRLIAVASLVVGLVYNTYVHINMPPDQNLWPVLVWMAVFLVQNVINSVREVNRAMELPIPAHERLIQATAFPKSHSRDWAVLSEAATKRQVNNGKVLLQVGAPTDCLQLMVAGKASERRPDLSDDIRRRAGAMWGELTWVLGSEMFNSSPCEVVVTSDKAEVWSWSYETLDKLCRNNDRLASALKDGFVRSAGLKHGLLVHRDHDEELGAHPTPVRPQRALIPTTA
jgi:hypothetical protein